MRRFYSRRPGILSASENENRMARPSHANMGLPEWQYVPNLAICCVRLCSEYVTANQEKLFLSFLANSSAPRVPCTTSLHGEKSCNNNELIKVRRCWHVCCYRSIAKLDQQKQAAMITRSARAWRTRKSLTWYSKTKQYGGY